MKCLTKFFHLSLLLLPMLFAQPAHAFYAWQDEASAIELRGLLRGSAVTLINPDNQLFYNRKNVSGMAVSGRLMLDASYDSLSFEVHAEQSYVPIKLQTAGSNFALLQGIERSDLLDWSFDHQQSHLILDRLNVQLATERINLKAGRQPVNLAATYYFTPNDFFAPFAAQTFFRSYKPGVDAVRADIQLAELSQLSLIGVLGYAVNPASDSGWSNRIDAARNSYLARLSAVFGDFEFALLAGSVKKDVVFGGDFQGELFDWLGLRGEGHVKWPDSPRLTTTIESSLALEHRWENTLTIRLEQYYHGSGATSTAAYKLATANNSYYLARHYSAIGASYEFTPLLTGDMTTIYNWVDQSALLALYALYSLTDESELALSGTVTTGDKPQAAAIRSEFGLYPDSVSIEYRAYF
ncbi:hypothetical protein [Mariprofundus micogutta]|nr:hypothetical protein [Mariprofundus micogutta]